MASNSNAKKLEEILTCLYCKKLFESPVILPCQETICKRDLLSLYIVDTRSIKCLFCNEVHDEPKEGFPKDRKLKEMLRLNLIRQQQIESQESSDSSLSESSSASSSTNSSSSSLVSLSNDFSLDGLANLISEFEALNGNKHEPGDFLHEFFNTLKHQIEKDRAEKLEIVNQSYDLLLNELDAHQNVFKSSYASEEVHVYNKKLMNKAKIKYNEWYELKNAKTTVDKFQFKQIQDDINKLEYKLRKNIDISKNNLSNAVSASKFLIFETKKIEPSSKNFGSLKFNKEEMVINQTSSAFRSSSLKVTKRASIDESINRSKSADKELDGGGTKIKKNNSEPSKRNVNIIGSEEISLKFKTIVDTKIVKPLTLHRNETFNAPTSEANSKNNNQVPSHLQQAQQTIQKQQRLSASIDHYGSVTATASNTNHSSTQKFEEIYGISTKPWFFDHITRSDAEQMLKLDINKQGSYLVRNRNVDDSTEPFCLSVRNDHDDIKHYKITVSEDQYNTAKVNFFYINKREKFKSIQDLINYYSKNVEGFCTRLTNVCQKAPSAPSWPPY